MQTLFTEPEIKRIIGQLSYKIREQEHNKPPVLI